MADYGDWEKTTWYRQHGEFSGKEWASSSTHSGLIKVRSSRQPAQHSTPSVDQEG